MKKPSLGPPPSKPQPPELEHEIWTVLHTFYEEISWEDLVKIAEDYLPKDLKFVHEYYSGYYDDSTEYVVLKGRKMVPNAQYAQQLAKYQTKLTIYEDKLKVYQAKKAQYEALTILTLYLKIQLEQLSTLE